MSDAFRSIRFHCNFHGQRVEGPVINPANWFGKVWLIEIPNGPLLAVEADHEQAAIDALADNSQYGHWINIPEQDAQEQEQNGQEVEFAGNDSHPVDTTMVRVWPAPIGLGYHVNWSPRFWQKTEMIESSIEEHDREVV